MPLPHKPPTTWLSGVRFIEFYHVVPLYNAMEGYDMPITTQFTCDIYCLPRHGRSIALFNVSDDGQDLSNTEQRFHK